MFTTTDGSSIAVTNANTAAQNQLGIVNRAGNSEDILVTLSNNTTFRVSFDSTDTTIAHIIDAIETASILNGNKRVLVSINDPIGSALVLQDLMFSAGGLNAATFRVQMLNSSTAGLLLVSSARMGRASPETNWTERSMAPTSRRSRRSTGSSSRRHPRARIPCGPDAERRDAFAGHGFRALRLR